MISPFELPITYFISPGDSTPENFRTKRDDLLASIGSAVNLGVSFVQIREKLLPSSLVFDLVRSAVSITGSSNTLLLVNDRMDIAVAAGANGVHLTTTSLPPAVVRQSFGEKFLIAASAHSVGEAEGAARGGADLIVFGPVYHSPGKGRPSGVEALRAVCGLLAPFPVLALGGITADNVSEVLGAGAAGFAGIRCFSDIRSLRSVLTATK